MNEQVEWDWYVSDEEFEATRIAIAGEMEEAEAELQLDMERQKM